MRKEPSVVCPLNKVSTKILLYCHLIIIAGTAMEGSQDVVQNKQLQAMEASRDRTQNKQLQPMECSQKKIENKQLQTTESLQDGVQNKQLQAMEVLQDGIQNKQLQAMGTCNKCNVSFARVMIRKVVQIYFAYYYVL